MGEQNLRLMIFKDMEPLVTGTPGVKIPAGRTALNKVKDPGGKNKLRGHRQDGTLKRVRSLQITR